MRRIDLSSHPGESFHAIILLKDGLKWGVGICGMSRK